MRTRTCVRYCRNLFLETEQLYCTHVPSTPPRSRPGRQCVMYFCVGSPSWGHLSPTWFDEVTLGRILVESDAISIATPDWSAQGSPESVKGRPHASMCYNVTEMK